LLLTLAKVIDARDPHVSGHSAKVAEYATAIARVCVNILRQDGKDFVVNSARHVTQEQGSRVFAMASPPDWVVNI
jgi:hypothetical protein